MMLEIAVTVVVLTFLWIFNKGIKMYAKGLEDKLKMTVVEDAVERAPELVALGNKLDELGEIPNLDQLLDRAHGKLKPTALPLKPEKKSQANDTVK